MVSMADPPMVVNLSLLDLTGTTDIECWILERQTAVSL
jgi:hypothetical protein